MTTIRKKETEDAYKKMKEARSASSGTTNFIYDLSQEEIIKTFTHWVLIPNQFPYDLIAEKHHMLVPKRVFGRLEEATTEEMEELYSIKDALSGSYNYVLETLGKAQSNTQHLHLHLIKLKENPCEC